MERGWTLLPALEYAESATKQFAMAVELNPAPECSGALEELRRRGSRCKRSDTRCSASSSIRHEIDTRHVGSDLRR